MSIPLSNVARVCIGRLLDPVERLGDPGVDTGKVGVGAGRAKRDDADQAEAAGSGVIADQRAWKKVMRLCYQKTDLSYKIVIIFAYRPSPPGNYPFLRQWHTTCSQWSNNRQYLDKLC